MSSRFKLRAKDLPWLLPFVELIEKFGPLQRYQLKDRIIEIYAHYNGQVPQIQLTMESNQLVERPFTREIWQIKVLTGLTVSGKRFQRSHPQFEESTYVNYIERS